MARKKAISRQRQIEVIEELVRGPRGVIELAADHGFTLEQMAEILADPENLRVLSRLILGGDLQTQVLLSQYRTAAVMRLIEQIGDAGRAVSVEGVRRACAELLRTQLVPAASIEAMERGEVGELEPDEASLRLLLYGDDPNALSPEAAHGSLQQAGEDANAPDEPGKPEETTS